MYSVHAEKLPKWLLIIIILIGVIVIFISIKEDQEKKQLKDTGCVTIGKVVEIEGYTLKYRYEVDGFSYYGEENSQNLDVNTGGKYKVYYNCSNPKQSSIFFKEKVE